MRLLDRLFGTRSPGARSRLAYRLLLSIAVRERPTAAPVRARATRAPRLRDRY